MELPPLPLSLRNLFLLHSASSLTTTSSPEFYPRPMYLDQTLAALYCCLLTSSGIPHFIFPTFPLFLVFS